MAAARMIVGLMAVAALAGGAGCATATSSPPLSNHPSAAAQIESFYDANAVESDWSCDESNMVAIVRAQVVRETPQQLVMAIHYDFDDEVMGTGRHAGGLCTGFSTRVFTFSKANGGVTLQSMSGPQRGMHP